MYMQEGMERQKSESLKVCTCRKGWSDRNRSLEVSQPVSKGLLMLIIGSHIVISVLLSEIELESSAEFL